MVVLTLVRMLTLVVMLVCVLEGKMAWVVERLDGWCITGSPGFLESSREKHALYGRSQASPRHPRASPINTKARWLRMAIKKFPP